MPNFDIVVIGASAGGVTYLQRIAERLPADFPAAVFVALHLPERATSVLPRILRRAGHLAVEAASNGHRISAGTIYVAPPGFHLTIERGLMRVTRGAREHGHRPAIDPLFRSAALAYGPRVIGIVLSGLLDDGTVGLLEIKRAGGVAVVQDPEDTAFPSMPRSAIAHVDVDHVLPADSIGDLLRELVVAGQAANPRPNGGAGDSDVRKEIRELTDRDDERDHLGDPSPYACPECGGVLWELKGDELMRFRCRVGHAYTADSLNEEQARAVEVSLWAAVRALEEQAAIKRRLAERASRAGHDSIAAHLHSRVRDIEKNADHVRALLLSGIAAEEPVPEA